MKARSKPLDKAKNIFKQNIQRFCIWLSWKNTGILKQEGVAYLPTGIHPDLEKNNSEDSSFVTDGKLKLVRYQLPEIYSKLAFHLATGEWREADQETWRVMRRVANAEYLNEKYIREFPRDDLRIINNLWVWYSGGKFGFSVQKSIWINCSHLLGENKFKRFRRFALTVDWYREKEGWIRYGELDFGQGVLGHLPSKVQPVSNHEKVALSMLSRKDL